MAVLELPQVWLVMDLCPVVLLSFIRVLGDDIVAELHGPLCFCVLLGEQVVQDVLVALDELFRVSLTVLNLLIAISLDPHEESSHLGLVKLLEFLFFLG